MGNTLKSISSRKSYNFQHNKITFKDYGKKKGKSNPKVKAPDPKGGKSKSKVKAPDPKGGSKKVSAVTSKDEISGTNKVIASESFPMIVRNEANIAGHKELARHGFPNKGGDYYHYSSHSFAYDNEKRVPLWVLEVLDKDNFLKTSYSNTEDQRKRLRQFSTDMNMGQYKSRPADYEYVENNKTFIKGQMAAASNHKNNESTLTSCQLLSNVLPLHEGLKNFLWTFLEMYVHEIAKQHRIWVTSGPIFAGEYCEPNNVFPCRIHLALGSHRVAVPTHLYKVMIAEIEWVTYISCFVMPNEFINVADNFNLELYKVSIDQLEELTGLQFIIHKDIEGKCKDLLTKYKFSMDICRNNVGKERFKRKMADLKERHTTRVFKAVEFIQGHSVK